MPLQVVLEFSILPVKSELLYADLKYLIERVHWTLLQRNEYIPVYYGTIPFSGQIFKAESFFCITIISKGFMGS